ncbi:MAG: sugar O-acetyltransferase, partial [Clostridia bacterium]|nr:sugar O-acetyltransferase [Clostridia bacterium]
MTSYEKMKSGMLYSCSDEALSRLQTECLELLYDYNATRPSEYEKRMSLLKNMFAEIGENCYIEP